MREISGENERDKACDKRLAMMNKTIHIWEQTQFSHAKIAGLMRGYQNYQKFKNQNKKIKKSNCLSVSWYYYI